jgi:hypothetical protein
MAVFLDQSSGLSAEAKEEIIRERRRFARDVKACLDACTQEETRRRLQRASGAAASFGKPSSTNPHTKAAHHSDFSAFAPLLTELHKWSPAARARKIWCRTLPHHSAVLSELATAFLPDSTTTEGERQQVLEVFGAIVRTWAAEGPDEVGARWLWLCSALRVPERQLRERGITLLSALMRGDPAYGVVFDVPETATTYLALAMSLLQLLHAVDCSPYGTTAEYDQLMKLFTDLMEGNIMDVDSDSMANVSGKETEGSTDGVLKELIWLGAARCIGADADVSAWLLKVDNPLTMVRTLHDSAEQPGLLILSALFLRPSCTLLQRASWICAVSRPSLSTAASAVSYRIWQMVSLLGRGKRSMIWSDLMLTPFPATQSFDKCGPLC